MLKCNKLPSYRDIEERCYLCTGLITRAEPGRFKQSCTAKVKLLNILFLFPKFTILTSVNISVNINFCKYFFSAWSSSLEALRLYLSKFFPATKKSKRLIKLPKTMILRTKKFNRNEQKSYFVRHESWQCWQKF